MTMHEGQLTGCLAICKAYSFQKAVSNVQSKSLIFLNSQMLRVITGDISS